MMAFLHILLLVVFCGAPVVAVQNVSMTQDIHGAFNTGPMNDVLFTQGLLFQTSAASRTDCGEKCLNLRECVTFTFKVIPHTFPAGTCWLYRHFHSVQDEKQAQVGAHNVALDKSESRCPYAGYTMQAGRCIQLVSDLLKYRDAKQRCQNLQEGHLFYAKTMADMEFVRQLTRDNGFHRVWLGGDNLAVTSQFRWTDGTLLPTDSSLWAPREPIGGKNKCVVMHAGYKKLDDIPCWHACAAVCQKNL